MKRHTRILFLIGCITLLLARLSTAQGAPNAYQIGFPAHGDFSGSEFDSVQINNNNLHIEIPLWTASGRGMGIGFKYVYDSKGWGFNEHCDRQGFCTDSVSPASTGHGMALCCSGGNHLALTLVTPQSYRLSYLRVSKNCNGFTYFTSSYHLSTPDGTKHHFVPDPVVQPGGEAICGLPSVTTVYADDGSGWIMQVDLTNGLPVKAIGRDGTVVPYGAATITDSNGNQIVNGFPSGTDTLGRPFNYDGSYTDSGGVLRSLSVVYQNVAIQTNLCLSSTGDACNEYSNTWSVPQTITLPDGLSYTFTYDQGSPTHPYYGQPLAVVLPTGGQITWGWSGEDEAGPTLVSRQLPGEPQPWTYTGNVTDPAGNTTVSTCAWYFTPYAPPGSRPNCYIITKKFYEGSSTSGTLIKTVQTDFQLTQAILPIHETTTWNQQNLVSRVETDYDAYPGWTVNSVTNNISASNPIAKREYAYGTPSWGALVRTTTFGYQHLSNATYRNLNLVGKVTSKKVYVGSQTGTLVAQTTYTYDGTSLTPTNATPAPNHDYTNFGATFLTRGNLTRTSQWLNTSGTWFNTDNTYDDLGNLRSTTDPGGHPTTFDYADSWADANCTLGSNTFAFPTQITDAAGFRTKKKYFRCTGLAQSVQNENDILAARAGTTFTYDLVHRVTQKNLPDGGLTTYCYSDVVGSPCYAAPPAALSHKETVKIDASHNLVTTTILDSLGRKLQTQLTDPDCTAGPVKVDYGYGFETTYLSSFTTVSNPYCQTSDTTYGIMTTRSDSLGRVFRVVPPDGTESSNNVSTTYAANCTTVTDQAGKSRKSCTDALGRLTQVFEDPAGLNYETDYTYDVLDNLTCVEQHGGVSGTGCSSPPSSDATSPWRVRRFSYDSLSRLTQATNPESGGISYTYDNDGNVLTKVAPKPNQTGTLTVTTTFTYDNLHRLKQKSYNDGTATVSYVYDGATPPTGCSPPALTDSNAKLNRTAMCDGAGSASWSHDSMNRVLSEKRILNALAAKTFTYTYNADGSLHTLAYPSTGKTISYEYNSAARLIYAKDIAGAINYVTSAAYAPQGALKTMKYGFVTSGFTGVTITNTYNKRLQPITLSAASPTATVMSLSYDFHLNTGDNGNVFQIVNNRDNNRTQNFAYDNLNRITTAATQGTAGSYCWGQRFGHLSGSTLVPGIDAWGNLFEITATQCNPTILSQTVSVKNQFGMTYDAAGNLTNDGAGHIYTYDGENRLTGTAGWTYVYDGDGKRVKKSNSGTNGTLYWTGMGTDAIAESNLSGTVQKEFIFFGGKRVARRDVTGSVVHYYYSDHLGSTNLVSDAVGTMNTCPGTSYISGEEESDYYPYGGERVVCDRLTDQNYKFTGKERDSESGLDDFEARHYSSSLGRFMQPDEFPGGPVDLFDVDDPASQALPYADIADPQSLNKYSYTYNNPLRYTDPNGHCPWCIGAAIGAATGFTASIVVQKWQHPDQAINWKSVGAATLGGAVAGATLGLAAPATLTTLGGTAVVSTAGVGETAAVGAAGGVAGGIAERTVENNGDVNKAMENPNAIVRDAAIGAGGEVVNRAVGAGVERVAGGAVSKAEAKVGRLTPESSSSRVKARTAELQKAQSSLATKTEAAKAAAGGAVAVADQKTRKKE
jgi:RHS repeat-associated protein